ncbi:mannosyltransferase family protein [Gordonia sinesedis]
MGVGSAVAYHRGVSSRATTSTRSDGGDTRDEQHSDGSPAARQAATGRDLGGLRWWVTPVLVYLVVRAVGIVVLARFAMLRDTSLGTALSVWDGKWMLAIAEYGYTGVPFDLTDARGIHGADTAFAFFPGYPYLVGLVAKLPLVTPFGAALALNLVLGCLAAAGAYRLGVLCTRAMTNRSPLLRENASAVRPERVGLFLVVIFAASPMAVVLNMAYTEALFCALAVWALVGVLERHWLVAGLAACAAGTVRPTAIVVIGVVMLAAMLAYRDGFRAWLAVVLSPLGYVGYLIVVWVRTGSPTGWFQIQTEGWGTRFDGGVAAFNFVNDALVDSGEVAPVATSWIMVITIVVVAVAIWARLPWPVLVYGTLVVASIVLSSGLMMSRPRLLLPAFVLLVPLAITLARAKAMAAVAVMVPIVVGSSWFGAHMLTVYPHAM